MTAGVVYGCEPCPASTFSGGKTQQNQQYGNVCVQTVDGVFSMEDVSYVALPALRHDYTSLFSTHLFRDSDWFYSQHPYTIHTNEKLAYEMSLSDVIE